MAWSRRIQMCWHGWQSTATTPKCMGFGSVQRARLISRGNNATWMASRQRLILLGGTRPTPILSPSLAVACRVPQPEATRRIRNCLYARAPIRDLEPLLLIRMCETWPAKDEATMTVGFAGLPKSLAPPRCQSPPWSTCWHARIKSSTRGSWSVLQWRDRRAV
ncbi:hypothetical protein BC828DRAFT_83999 [Blastocladiella britannica]|nr:hypothetical protein BC828DRAFT_83999 [Blastocladiella britannica]